MWYKCEPEFIELQSADEGNYAVKSLAAFLVSAFLAAPLCAQQPQQKLTLASALDLAEKQNLDLVAARAQRAVALAGIKIAGQIANPIATFDVLRDSPHESLFFDQPLEIGGQRRRRMDLAREETQITEIDISALERLVRRSVREAYYGVAFARGVTAQADEIVKLNERLRDTAQTRFDSGDIPKLEVTQAELELARARVEFQVALQEEKVALSQLNALLNEPPGTPWDVQGSLEMLPARPQLDDLISRAGGTNADLQRVAEAQKVEARRRELLKAQRIPNIGLEFGSDFNNPPSFQVGLRGGLIVELPIFTRNQGEIAQSLANSRALESEQAATRRSVAGRVEQAYFELDSREAEAQLYEKDLVPASKQLESLAEDSYHAGKANILTVLGAQRDVQQVEHEYLLSLLAVQQAFAALEEAVGAPLD